MFPAIPTSVALNALFSLRRHFLAKHLAWSIAYPVSVALQSTLAKQGVHYDNLFGEHNQIIEKNLPNNTLVHGLTVVIRL